MTQRAKGTRAGAHVDTPRHWALEPRSPACHKGSRREQDDASRTFVVSDAHGYPDLIGNALAHGRFRRGIDRLVYAGDFVDRGPDPEGCLEIIEALADVILVGNHELAVLVGFELFEQTPQSRRLRHYFIHRVLGAGAASSWKAVVCVDGVLISHAGLSRDYAPLFRGECRGRPDLLAARLNREFVRAVRRELGDGSWDDDGILGDRGPLWFRPGEWGGGVPLEGVTQVVGHSPPLSLLEVDGFFMVDPCVFRGRGHPGRYRYAVIESGGVWVEQGILDEGGVERRPTTAAPLLGSRHELRRAAAARRSTGGGRSPLQDVP